MSAILPSETPQAGSSCATAEAIAYRIAEVEKAWRIGFSFTPLTGKIPNLKSWQALPREPLEAALGWARRGNVGLRAGRVITIDGVEWMLIVVDVDPAHGGSAAFLGQLKTPTVLTGGSTPGSHHYMLVPVGTLIGNSAGTKLGTGIDVRGIGGQVVFPGSLHPETGHMYRWADGLSPSDVPLAVMPEALLQALTNPNPKPRPAPKSVRQAFAGPRYGAYVRAAVAAEVARVRDAAPGTRNSTLNRAAFALGQLVGAGVLNPTHAYEALWDALSAHFRNGFTEQEAVKTINSGLTDGEDQPRDLSTLEDSAQRKVDDPDAQASKVAAIRERISCAKIEPGTAWEDVLQSSAITEVVRAIAELPRAFHRTMADRMATHLEFDVESKESKSIRLAIQAAYSLVVEEWEAEKARNPAPKPPSVAELMIEIGSECELVHDDGRECFALVEVAGADGRTHREVHPIESRQFETWLSGELWKQHGETAADVSIKSAQRVLSAKALFEGREVEVPLRVCRDANGICWYDLGDPQWRAIRIRPSGWEIVERPPVLFRRYHKTAAQVVPIPGGTLQELRSFFHLKRDSDWYLLCAWLVAGFIPGSPRGVLVLNGEHGTAKTTTARICRRFLDPAVTELISPPPNLAEYAQSALHSWAVALDNLSFIPQWLSDAICRTVTGEAFEKRKLYTDAEDMIWRYRRLVILTSIANIVTRPDLLDRSLLITLERFRAGELEEEEIFWSRFEDARPRLLNALLSAVAATLRELPHVRAVPGQRLADFTRIGMAVGRALGWPEGAFEDAIAGNTTAQVEEAIEASPTAQSISRFCETPNRHVWEGTASELLKELREGWNEDTGGALPKKPNRLSEEVRRAAPALRKVGIDVSFFRAQDQKRTRRIRIQWVPNRSSGSSEGESAVVEPGPSSARGSPDWTIADDPNGVTQDQGLSNEDHAERLTIRSEAPTADIDAARTCRQFDPPRGASECPDHRNGVIP